MRPNTTGLWEDRFEYVSPCGRELNFIEVDDTPIVFGRLVQDDADQHGEPQPRSHQANEIRRQKNTKTLALKQCTHTPRSDAQFSRGLGRR